MDKEIDLGVSPKEMHNSMPEPMPMKDMAEDSKPIYPHLHYSGPVELHLPEEGEMTVCFKKTSETSSVRSDGSHWYECCIEIHSLKDVESEEDEAPTRSYDDASEALDKLAEALRGAKRDEES